MPEGGNKFGKFAEESVSGQTQSNSLKGEQLDMPGLIRSGSSSPNVHDMASDGPPLSPADKKRNKLGYHRTAVACGQLSSSSSSPISLLTSFEAIAGGAKFAAFLLLTIPVVDAKIAFA